MRLSRFFITFFFISRSLPLGAALGLALSTAALAQPITIDRVLVVVNEAPITLSEYQTRHRREVLQKSSEVEPFDGSINPRILDILIDERIQAQTAIRRGIRVAPGEVNRTIAAVARQNNASPQELLERLARDGITPDQFRASLREQQLIRRLADRMVSARVAVSEREVENYLESHREPNASEVAYEVSHLFISLREKTDSETQSEYENLEYIRENLLQGRSFEKSAREFSDGQNKEEGGYIGWRRVSQLPDFFEQALWRRQACVGTVSEILTSESGLHLIKIHDQRGGEIIEQQLLKHILLRPGADLNDEQTREFADELHARIVAGEDFEKIARAHSADQASGVYGGLLGWVNPGDFPPEFEQAIHDLPLNEVSEPLRTRNGYHLVQVLKRCRTEMSVDLALKRAQQIIFQRKAADFYNSWYGVIRDNAHIEYISVNPGS